MYDLDVNNYNETELLKIFGVDESIDNINESIDNITKTDIHRYVKTFKKAIDNKNYDKDDKKSLLKFIDNAKEKLLTYIENRVPVQLLPMNYDILKSQNQLSGGDHMVTSNKIITTDPDYNPGVLNPIEKKMYSRIINIDSTFRDNYTKTSGNSFMWSLVTPETNVVSLRLNSVELPVMWYDISEMRGNNRFIVKLYNMKKYVDSKNIIIIPSGNYNNVELSTIINQTFMNMGSGLNYLTMSISDVTTKSEFRAVNITDSWVNGAPPVSVYDENSDDYSPDFYFDIIFFSDDIIFNKNNCRIENERQSDLRFRRTIGWYMGFNQQQYTVRLSDTLIVNTTNIQNQIIYSAYLSSESSFGTGRLQYLYIAIDDYNNNWISESICSYTGNVFIANNLLGRIAVNTPTNEIMMNTKNDTTFYPREYLGPVTISKIHVKLVDKFGDLIDLNNNDFSFSLEVTKIYR